MTNLVPDPSATDLTYQAAKSQATQVMDILSNTILLYLDAEVPALRSNRLEEMSSQTGLLHALLAHIEAQEAKA
ncbi:MULTISPECIES: hypothetical protein [unclassified Pseudomonas]|uniref:hypothetical protein n=1 Tax=unclassified Pseudomonas TaxID=196821 RepID=UPI001AA00551|nr:MULTISPECIES: hypothetical protein [unclassified Pseudomonas]MCE5991547.1 hypothetical protein [Pseudomonas sp. KCA11]